MAVHPTRQRKAIHQAIMLAPGPLSPNDILSLATQEVPKLGIATVYRTINLLLEAGDIQAVPINANDVRYEPCDRGHHHHFLCRVCNTVYDIKGCAGQIAKMLPADFEMDEHEILIHGTCAECKTTD